MNVNEYFDGQVKSIGFENQEGRATSGVMAVGEYEFGTTEPERMVIVSGELDVTLPDADSPQKIRGGSEFRVPAGVKFGVNVKQATAYVCFYGSSSS
ncbi:MAG: pyrimidine/purine nucleoside phosphorylase [Planctomycetota bacterium]